MANEPREDSTERYRIGDFTLWVATDDLAERVTGKRWTVWLGHAGERMTFDQAEGVVMALGDTRQEAVQEAVATLEALTAKLQETPPPVVAPPTRNLRLC